MDQLPIFTNVVQGDTANTPGAYVKRDASGNIAVGQATVAGLVNSAGTALTPNAAMTGAASIPAGATIVPLDATAAAFNATLPPASTSAGAVYVFIKIDSSAHIPTIKGSGSDNITSPAGTANTYAGLTTQGNMALCVCALNSSATLQWWIGKLS